MYCETCEAEVHTTASLTEAGVLWVFCYQCRRVLACASGCNPMYSRPSNIPNIPNPPPPPKAGSTSTSTSTSTFPGPGWYMVQKWKGPNADELVHDGDPKPTRILSANAWNAFRFGEVRPRWVVGGGHIMRTTDSVRLNTPRSIPPPLPRPTVPNIPNPPPGPGSSGPPDAWIEDVSQRGKRMMVNGELFNIAKQESWDGSFCGVAVAFPTVRITATRSVL